MVKIIFLHPDLGIGGAERAVIDAALAFKSKGHAVQFVTAHHDPNHCFPETIDGTFKVTCVGDWLPRSFLCRFFAFFAYLRMIYAAIYLVFFSSLEYEVIFCDQISACIPFLRASHARILFYCHFPDMLLTQRKSFLKKLYRAPIDWIEEKTTARAHLVLVNSKFTAEVFKKTFTSLHYIDPEVLYPIPDFSAFDKPVEPLAKDIIPPGRHTIFLSINRYTRQKNHGLGIEALGGYDERVRENKEEYLELRKKAEKFGLVDNITFLRSISDAQKRSLLKTSTCLLYTPENEHFGIVPIEAMYMKCPVIAANSGGPKETVKHETTGYLCEPTPEDFAEAMIRFIKDKELKNKLGTAGKARVEKVFSFDSFTNHLEAVLQKLMTYRHVHSQSISMIWSLVLVSILSLGFVAYVLSFAHD
ncbi:hypothetical protein KUTeg_016783 [Tegillarca granosa]|uniref:Alpha-1,3/1,6-mannosyltransferase ALG2 n=1 Tax=Tegillarca granosa TaxID=220873 RepID=A0ABQ9ESJ6_TEGGR|nr:hypothetical protein KUTeg_016783 [Tegillarca granosa]